jgi:hypothetical protein
LPKKNNINLVINLVTEVTFLTVSLVYYRRMYNRCESFKTPIIPFNKKFPMSTSNRVLSYDCTASNSDSVILILKAAAFLMKMSVIATINNCLTRRKKRPPTLDYQTLGNVSIIENEIKLEYCTKYPRQIYQALLAVVIPTFLTLTITSWLPTYNQFNASNKNCPNFYSTCWNSLKPNGTLNADCHKEMYKWQKFSWAGEFLLIVIATFTLYQLLKMAYLTKRLCCEESTTNFSRKIKSCWDKAETQLALPATMLLLTESLGISHLLIVSGSKFPGGTTHLLVQSFTTALNKLNDQGYIDSEFTTLDINLTAFDQQIFYGLLAAQLFVIPLSISLYVITKTRRSTEEINHLTTNIGQRLRSIIGALAIVAPFITSTLFFLAAIISIKKDTCFLDNFFHSVFNIFNQKSEIILPGHKKACNLYSLTAYQGSAILQTSMFIEASFSFPFALFSIITILDICVTKKNAKSGYLLTKMSFLRQSKTIGQANRNRHRDSENGSDSEHNIEIENNSDSEHNIEIENDSEPDNTLLSLKNT